MPKLYVIAGCNGAGKTTTAYTVLPDILRCCEFVNADEIARGLSPFNYDEAAVAAGKLMLERIKELLDERVDFAFETTLAARSFYQLIVEAQKRGYHVMLVYMWLQTPEIAISRVEDRVAKGGHGIKEDVLRRRYVGSINNLFKYYLNLVDYAIIVDNSGESHVVVAEKELGQAIRVANQPLYEALKSYERE